jgi:AcrR family transcriptional regulator
MSPHGDIKAFIMAGPKKTSTGSGHSRDKKATRKLLIEAVGTVLAREGFTGVGVNAVARQAGVDKVLIYRYFGGMEGLMKAFGQEGDFWPSIEELAGGDLEAFQRLSFQDKLIAMGCNFLKGIRNRPLTQEVMAWELVQRNTLTEELEIIRETRMLRFAELFLPTEGAKTDLMAIIVVVGAGLSYLVCRGRKVRWYNGVDLESESGWQRLDAAVEQIVKGVLLIS